jgi:hypothetical protein
LPGIGTDTQRPQAARRRRLFPDTGDTLAAIATRELADDPDALTHLLSWNLHLSLRRQPVGPDSRLLGTDIVYLEPPLP